MTALRKAISKGTPALFLSFCMHASATPKLIELDESTWLCDSYQAAVRIDNLLIPRILKWDDEKVRDYAESHGCGRLTVGTRMSVINADTVQRGDVQVRLSEGGEEGYIPEFSYVHSPFQAKLREDTTACTTVGAWFDRMGVKLNTPRPGDIQVGQHCVELPENTVLFKEPKTKFNSFYRVYLDNEDATEYWLKITKK